MLVTACSPAPRIIALATHDSLQLYDTAQNSYRAFSVGRGTDRQIRDVVFAADGASAFTVVQHDSQQATVLRLRLTDGAPLAEHHLTDGVVASQLTLVAKGRRLWMSSFRSSDGTTEGRLTEFAADSLILLRQVSVCSGQPTGGAVLSDINRMYVRCTDVDALVEVDLDLGRVVQVRPLANPGCGHGTLASERTGGRLFLPCGTTGQLLVVDRRRLTAFDSVAIGDGIAAITVDHSDRFAVVSRPAVPELVVVDLTAQRLRRRWPVSGPTNGLILRSSDGWVFGLPHGSDRPANLFTLILPDSLATSRLRVSDVQSMDLWPRGHTPVFYWIK